MFYLNFKKILSLFIPKNFLKKPYIRNRVLATLSLLIIDLSVTALTAYNYKIVINTLSNNKLNQIWINLWLLGIYWIITKIIHHIQEIVFFPVVNFAIKEVTYNIIQHLHAIPLVKYHTLGIPEVINSIRRISISARSFIKTLILTIIPTIIKLIISIIIVTRISIYGIIIIPIIMIAGLILYLGIKQYSLFRKNAWHVTDQAISRINDSILNTKTVRACIDLEMQKILDLLDLEFKCWQQTNNSLHWTYIRVFVVLGLGTIGILSIIVIAIQQGRLTIGDFLFLKTQLISTFIPFKNFMFESKQIIESMVDIKKIIELLEIPINNNSNIFINFQNQHDQSIYIENISFAHNKNPIIKNFSLRILTGEKVIITGKNGSGKSTLVNLITGLYQPDQGKIFIEGKNIQSINPKIINQKIHCIQQDFKLFNASLFYNITYGNDLDLEKLNSILPQFKFMDFINKFPLKLNTIVGEMGCNLSAGEKQKVAIFRALLMQPSILILDETTNCINYQQEKEILNLICNYIPTLILVSHSAKLPNIKARVINLDQIHLKLQQAIITK